MLTNVWSQKNNKKYKKSKEEKENKDENLSKLSKNNYVCTRLSHDKPK